MKNHRSKLGLSILAGGLSFVGSASAIDLIVNGSFEEPSGGREWFGGHCGDFSGNLCRNGNSTCSGTIGWQSFNQYNYSLAYYAGPPIPPSENPGNYYSFRQAAGWTEWTHFLTPAADLNTFLSLTVPQYGASETVMLTDAATAADIDAGLAQFTFSSWLASYTEYSEQPYLVLQFFSDASGQPTHAIGTRTIFDRCYNTYAVTYADGNTSIPLDLHTDHNWIKYIATDTIPVGARQATVFITRSPSASSGGTDNGGDPSGQNYVDLVKLDVSGPTAVLVPPNLTAAAGNRAALAVSISGTDLSYQWRQNGTNLLGRTDASLPFPVVQLTNAGSYDVVVTNLSGSVTSAPPAVFTVLNPLVFATGQWDFLQANLAASYGADLQYNGTAGDTTFGTTTSFSIANINGVATPVMHFTPSTAQWGGYKAYHGAVPNDGGDHVKQYTLIYDIYYPSGSDATWRSLWQTDVSNAVDNDADLFVNPDNGIGISGVYDGTVTPDQWHRIALAFDLTGTETGTAYTPVLTKFIDGVKVGNQTANLTGNEGQWSLGPYALLFADNDGDVQETYVSSVQFSNGRRPDAFIEALGGPSPLKIPGIIKAAVESGQVVIRWSGGVALQSADSPKGPWTAVSGTAGQSSYNPPAGQKKYYRPQIP